MNSANAIVLALGDPASSDASRDIMWWRVIDGHIVAEGRGLADLPPIEAHDSSSGRPRIIALVPVSQTMLHQPPLPAGITAKQALALAAHLIAEQGPDPADSLHIAPATSDDAATSSLFVSVPAVAMSRWTQWAAQHELPLDLLIPACLLLPAEGDTAVRATIGPDAIIRAGNMAFPAEAGLIEAIIGSDAALIDLSAEQVERAIIAACEHPPANLLTGRWTRQNHRIQFDPSLLPLIARLAAVLILVSLAIPLTRIILLHRDADRLDAAAMAATARIISPAPPIDQAITRIDGRLAELGGGPALLTTPVATLVQAMEAAPTVNVDSIGWAGDGVLSVTLGGPRNEDINPVLEAIQRSGYRITAQPRAGSDGRALADVTMRTAP